MSDRIGSFPMFGSTTIQWIVLHRGFLKSNERSVYVVQTPKIPAVQKRLDPAED
jgi:hypothetical protein